MALNINGTTGISGVDGSVSAPAVTGTDSNTGITFPSADTIKFSTRGVERMQITNSGVSGTGIGSGKILQVEQGTLASQTAIGSTSYGDLGLSKAITPQTNSKVLVLINIQAYLHAEDNEGFGIKLIRTPSGGSATTLLTSASKFDVYAYTNFTGEFINSAQRSSWIVLDSSVGGDGSTAITYKVQVAGYTTSSISYSNNNNQSSITLFEIGA